MSYWKISLIGGILLLVPLVVNASEIRTSSHSYSFEGVKFQGYLARPKSSVENPGVLILHQWRGLTGYERRRARKLANLGYVAFAGDIYGADTRPATDHEAALASKTFRENRHRYRKRVRAALSELRSIPTVNENRVAAIGYCFGGTGVLELARSGADVKAVVSFHGGLTNPSPRNATNIQSVIQVHHGARDPHVSRESVNSFWDEMKHSGADWELHVYSNAVHSFTEKEAGRDPSNGSAYNERADRLSWNAMKRLFRNKLRQSE